MGVAACTEGRRGRHEVPWLSPRPLDVVRGCAQLKLPPLLSIVLFLAMTPEVLEAPVVLAPSAPAEPACPARRAPSTDALLFLDQVAILLGETLKGARHLTSMGLLKHQLIDGECCVRLGDLIAYKRDFDRAYAEYLKSPTSRMPDDLPNPIDVFPEYAHMRRR